MSIFPVGDVGYDAILVEEKAMIAASEAIAEALEVSGLSQTEFAKKLGVSKSEVCARLQGERNITVRKLAATLHALGVSLTIAADIPHPSRPVNLQEWKLSKGIGSVHREERGDLLSTYRKREIAGA